MGLFAFEPTRVYHMRGVPDDRIGVTVDCRPVADRKVAGLGEHRSQHHVMSDDPSDTERWKRLVGREWWVAAWPERPPGRPCSATFSRASIERVRQRAYTPLTLRDDVGAGGFGEGWGMFPLELHGATKPS